MNKKIKDYLKREEITLRNLLNLRFLLKFFYKTRYLHFCITGTTGVLLNLFFSWLFVEFIFLESEYLIFNFLVMSTTLGVIIGQTINLIYNFSLHTKMTFKTKKDHKKRFTIFIVYSLFITYAVIVPLILILRNFFEYTFPHIYLRFLVGFEYLVASAIIILFFSIFNFIVFKIWLFKEEN